MNQEALKIGLDKILSFRWKYDEAMQDIYVSHTKAYLHSSAIWAEKFKKIKEFPFFDFTECISGDAEIPQRYFLTLDNYFEDFYYLSTQVKATCYWYLNWIATIDESELKTLNLPNPFESLISLYEKNGHFRQENKFLWLNTEGLPIHDFSIYLTFG